MSRCSEALGKIDFLQFLMLVITQRNTSLTCKLASSGSQEHAILFSIRSHHDLEQYHTHARLGQRCQNIYTARRQMCIIDVSEKSLNVRLFCLLARKPWRTADP